MVCQRDEAGRSERSWSYASAGTTGGGSSLEEIAAFLEAAPSGAGQDRNESRAAARQWTRPAGDVGTMDGETEAG